MIFLPGGFVRPHTLYCEVLPKYSENSGVKNDFLFVFLPPTPFARAKFLSSQFCDYLTKEWKMSFDKFPSDIYIIKKKLSRLDLMSWELVAITPLRPCFSWRLERFFVFCCCVCNFCSRLVGYKVKKTRRTVIKSVLILS